VTIVSILLFAAITLSLSAAELAAPRAQDSSKQVPFFLSPAEDTVPQWVRDARNNAYNVRPGRPAMIDPEESGLLPLTVVDFAPQPELPYAESDVVVVGNITHLQPFLSTDKKNIYTEYTLKVVEPVKNAVGVPALPGDSLTLLRQGGVARFSDGRVVKHEIRNGVEPVPNQQYLVFLRYRPQLDAFAYRKIWLIREGVMKAAYPDDLSREHSGKSEYSGKPLQEVLVTLRDKVKR